MKKFTRAVCAAVLMAGLSATPAMAENVTATLPTFPVTLNGVVMEQQYAQYPLLVYKDITYVPMTWEETRLLGLETTYTQADGLGVNKAAVVQAQSVLQGEYEPYKADTANGAKHQATVAAGTIHVNGKSIDNSAEEYPLLLYRDITYFPLTWRFAVDEFGWGYTFDMTNGLVITPTVTAANTSVNVTSDIVGKKVVVNASDVYLREAAGTGSEAIGMAQKGYELIVLGTKTVDGKEWYQVMDTNGGDTMWIAGWLTKVAENQSSSTNSNTGSTQITSTTTVNSMVGKTVEVIADSLNLRADTSTDAAVIGQTKKGDTYTVLAVKEANNLTWYQVKTSIGARAWIAAQYVQEPSSETVSTEITVGSEIVINANSVNLREAPVSGAVDSMVNKGTRFTVLAIKTVNGADWYQVRTSAGNTVWVASWLTTAAAVYENTLVTGSNASTGELTGLELISVEESADKTVVKLLHGVGNAVNTLNVSNTGVTLLLDNVYLNGSMNSTYSGGPLEAIKAQTSSSNVVNLALTLEYGAYCAIAEEDSALVITVYSQQSSSSNVLKDKLIVIDPGHGVDPGAIGTVLGVTDAEVGLDVGLKLRDLLEAQGATVIMTRETDVRVALNDRPALANQVEADLFISIHGNAIDGRPDKSGIETYYYAPSSNAQLYAQSIVRASLAQYVSEGLGLTTSRPSEVRTANYAVLRENNHPSILVETGYLTNAEEEALLATDAYRQKLAEGIFIGVLNYLSQY